MIKDNNLSGRLTTTLTRCMKGFARQEDGTAGVELTIVLCIFLLPLWLGFAEIGKIQERQTVINTSTAMIADMVAQLQDVKKSDIDDIIEAARIVTGDKNTHARVMAVVIPKKADPGKAQAKPYIKWAAYSWRDSGACGTYNGLPANVATPTDTDRIIIVADGWLWFNNELQWVTSIDDEWFQERSFYAPRVTAETTGPNMCS